MWRHRRKLLTDGHLDLWNNKSMHLGKGSDDENLPDEVDLLSGGEDPRVSTEDGYFGYGKICPF
jgi:hypothetical protein